VPAHCIWHPPEEFILVQGQALWPTTDATPTIMRVVWCLATYYVFILIHRVLKSRGTAVFKHSQL
jgi:hypothetical protein